VFIRAVFDRYHDFLATHCRHQTVPFSEVVQGVTAYLRQHASERDQPASGLILASIKGRYGCEW
jgi:hypothetical protein